MPAIMNLSQNVLLLHLASVAAFLGKPSAFYRDHHVLYLDDEIAKLIDEQLWRQNHESEVEAEWQKRNAAVLEKDLPVGFDFEESGAMMDDESVLTPRQRKKDTLLASKNPAAYCADRCVATGNCDVFEDVFKLSPKEVLIFCEECVLSDGEEPCDIPEAFLEDGGLQQLKP